MAASAPPPGQGSPPALRIVDPLPNDRADLNLRILHPLLNYAVEKFGVETRDAILKAAALTPKELKGSHWVSWEQFELIAEQIRELLPDDDTFIEACVFRFDEGYGPLRFLIWAVSPALIYELSARTASAIVRIATLEVESTGTNSLTCRYRSTKPESRLMTLSRVAQMSAMPTIWGLPKAEVEVTKSISNGDEFDEYDIRYYHHRRWGPLLLGTSLGVVAAIVAAFWSPSGLVVLFPILGYCLALAFESLRTNRANLAHGSRHAAALHELAKEEADARQELIEMHRRQREWSRMLEDRVAERTDMLEGMVSQVRSMDESRQRALLGVSHDLNNPLMYLKVEADLLAELRDGENLDELLVEHREAVSRIEKLLRDLMTITSSDAGLVEIHPEELDVRSLTEGLRARLKALVYGKRVSITVFATREAPERVETDIAVFDRVVDNLLTNAAKYTDRGSILLELDGRPGYLTVKVSDTGPGIGEEALEAIFSHRKPRSTTGRGYGVGLSVVVQLMGQLGGTLEVMSKPGSGTTFWAHFPERLGADSDARPTPSEDLVGRVVTIRPSL